MSSKSYENLIGITLMNSAFRESLAGPTSFMSAFQESQKLRESLAGSTSIMSAFQVSQKLRESLAGPISIMSAFQESQKLRESLAGSTSIMSAFQELQKLRESLAGPTSIMSAFQESQKLRESLAGSTSIMSAFQVSQKLRESLAGPTSIMSAFQWVFSDLTNENLTLDDKIQKLNEFDESFQKISIEIDSETINTAYDDYLIEYWAFFLNHVVKVYKILDSKMVFRALLDFITVISFIMSFQSGDESELNIYNNSDSNIEVNIDDNKIDVYIEEIKESEKNDGVELKNKFILSPGERT